MEKQSELQREELKMRKQELDDKRNQNEAMHQQMMIDATTAVTATDAKATTAIYCYDVSPGEGTCCREVMLIDLITYFVAHVDSYDVTFSIYHCS